MKQNKIYQILLLSILVLLSGVAIYKLGYKPESTLAGKRILDGIQPYNYDQDSGFIKRLFKENWNWLIPDGQGFPLDAFLELRPTRPGKPISTIKVLYEKNTPIGFTAYQKENFYTGELRFITIDTPYRGKGHSEKLMCHALQDMRSWGLSRVELQTRLDNKPALALYEKLGFKELWRDAPYIRLERSLLDGPCINN